MITFGSLFAGIGGFDLGFERAGMRCEWQVEIEPFCQKVLAKHWPNVRRHGDVRTFPPDGEWGVDVICCGFPCQDISYCGHGAGLEGERSGLFFEAVRVVRQLRPQVVVLENVAALFTRGLDVILGTMAEIGFDAEWHCIPACAFGAPHTRERVFVVSYAAGGRFQRGLQSKQYNKSKGEEWNGEPSRILSRAWHRWTNDPSDTRVANGVSGRVDRVRGYGNAVVPQVAQWLGERIVEHFLNPNR